MRNPLDRLDPDPLDAAEQERARRDFFGIGDYSDGFRHGWDAAESDLSVEGLAALLVAALSGALVGAALMWVALR